MRLPKRGVGIPPIRRHGVVICLYGLLSPRFRPTSDRRQGRSGADERRAIVSANHTPVYTVTIRLYGTLAQFVAPVPAMHSHGAPLRGVLVSLPTAAILTEKGAAGAHDHRI